MFFISCTDDDPAAECAIWVSDILKGIESSTSIFQTMFGREFIRISSCQKTAIIVQSISRSQSQHTVSSQRPVSKDINNGANTHFAHACLRDWIYKCIHLHSKQVESAEFVLLRPPVVHLFYYFRTGFLKKLFLRVKPMEILMHSTVAKNHE